MFKYGICLLVLMSLVNCTAKRPVANQLGPWDPLGTYTLEGVDVQGNAYAGTLKLMPFGADGYKAVWVVGTAFSGVGVWIDGLLVIGFGEECGGGLYRLPEDGKMYGVFMSPEGEAFKERADAKELKSELTGIWLVRGLNLDGTRYSTYLMVRERDPYFEVLWKGKETQNGLGLVVGEHLTLAYGNTNCGMAVFERQPDGTLRGQWIRAGLTGVGTEVARAD